MGCGNSKNFRSNYIQKYDSSHKEKFSTKEKSQNFEDSPKQGIIPYRKSTRIYQSIHDMPRQIKETKEIKYGKDSYGNKMINDYKFIKNIGKGSFATVKLAIKDGKKYAIKVMRKSFLTQQISYYRDESGEMQVRNSYDDVQREIAIMKKIQHPNIVNLYEVIQNPNNEKIYLVMEFCCGGQLIEWEDEDKFIFTDKKRTQPFPEDYLRKIFRDCILGLNYLHKNDIIHRDIKPQNILLNGSGHAQICDFGISVNTSRQSQADALRNVQGTQFFLAPEVLDTTYLLPENSSRKHLIDVWSLGITFYSFVFLQLPFYVDNYFRLGKAIKQLKLKFPKTVKISKGLKEIFKKMLDKNIQKRITLEELAQMPWINENCQTKLIDILNIDKQQEKHKIEVNDIKEAFQISKKIGIRQIKGRRQSKNLKSDQLPPSCTKFGSFNELPSKKQSEDQQENQLKINNFASQSNVSSYKNDGSSQESVDCIKDDKNNENEQDEDYYDMQDIGQEAKQKIISFQYIQRTNSNNKNSMFGIKEQQELYVEPILQKNKDSNNGNESLA